MKKSKWSHIDSGRRACCWRLVAARLLAATPARKPPSPARWSAANANCTKPTECQNVLQVEKDGKTVNYYLTQNKVSKDFHSNICQNDGEKVTVTGTVKEKDGKEMMAASKIEAVK